MAIARGGTARVVVESGLARRVLWKVLHGRRNQRSGMNDLGRSGRMARRGGGLRGTDHPWASRSRRAGGGVGQGVEERRRRSVSAAWMQSGMPTPSKALPVRIEAGVPGQLAADRRDPVEVAERVLRHRAGVAADLAGTAGRPRRRSGRPARGGPGRSIASSSRSNSSGWVAPPTKTRSRTVPGRGPAGELDAQERDGQDRSPLDGRDDHAEAVERMLDLVAAVGDVDDDRRGIGDRAELQGQVRVVRRRSAGPAAWASVVRITASASIGGPSSSSTSQGETGSLRLIRRTAVSGPDRPGREGGGQGRGQRVHAVGQRRRTGRTAPPRRAVRQPAARRLRLRAGRPGSGCRARAPSPGTAGRVAFRLRSLGSAV